MGIFSKPINIIHTSTRILPYNIVTLFLLFITTVLSYWFIYLLSKNKFISLTSSLILITSTSYLNMFAWHTTAQGIPFAIAISLISLIFLVYFQKTSSSSYYILSLIFFAASIKGGFVRSAGMISIPLFLLLFSNTDKIKSKFYKFFFSAFYLLIWLAFLLFNFARQPLGVSNGDSGFSVANYLTAIFYYISQLFIPAFWANQIFLPIAVVLKGPLGFLFSGAISVAVIIGGGIFFSLLTILIVGFIRRKVLANWLLVLGIILIITNIFYLPIFQDFLTDSSKLDSIFSRLSPPYGPGSRYLFPSSLGVGLLFAIFLWRLSKRNKALNALSKIILVVVIYINGSLSIYGHRIFIEGEMRPTAVLVNNIFSMVPRDGKPKLLFSSNNMYKNQIDVNHGGGGWLYGFYKTDELIYVNNMKELKELIDNGKYKKENFYAFYANPETSSFANISSDFRNMLFNAEKSFSDEKTSVEFIDSKPSTTMSFINDRKDIFISSRALAISKEISRRVISQKSLDLDMKISTKDFIFPFMDVVIKEKLTAISKDLWEKISTNGPLIVKTSNSIVSDLALGAFNNISKGDKLKIIEILKQREDLKRGLSISVSNIYEDDDRIKKESLTDGIFNSDPAPTKDESFYLAKTTPVTIIFKFPHAITLGRLLLNTSKSFSTEHIPIEADVLASLGGNYYEKVGSLGSVANSDWSPNGGKLINISLKSILADSIKIVVTKTAAKPVSFDEMIIDNYDALEYLPEQIYNYSSRAFWYVDDKDVLNKLLADINHYELNLVYACAEDQDWQKQNGNLGDFIPEVWNIRTISIDDIERDQTRVSVPINCYGSVLRRIIIIGPPFPSKLEIKNASIN